MSKLEKKKQEKFKQFSKSVLTESYTRIFEVLVYKIVNKNTHSFFLINKKWPNLTQKSSGMQ